MKKLFCNHNYSILKNYRIKSEAELIIENPSIRTATVNTNSKSVLIIVYKCSKCSKIKESVHVNNYR